MNKQDRERIYRLTSSLEAKGFSLEEIHTLRKASNTLSRWCERECNGEVERDETTGKTHSVFHSRSGNINRYRIPDRETGAKKRIDKILASHPGWAWYYQADPRGCAVYLYNVSDFWERWGSKPGLVSIDSVYSSIGIAVY